MCSEHHEQQPNILHMYVFCWYDGRSVRTYIITLAAASDVLCRNLITYMVEEPVIVL